VHELDDVFGDGKAEAGAPLMAGAGAVLLAEGLEELRQEDLVHAYAGVPDHEAQGGLVPEAGDQPDLESDPAAGGRELDGVAEDVDDHLLQLHAVADVVVPESVLQPAAVRQALFLALAAAWC